MSKNLLQMMGLSLIVAVVATCTDQTPTAAPNDAESITPALGSALACDLTISTQIPADVRNFFSSAPNTTRNAARDKASQLSSACGAGEENLTRQYALDLLDLMEAFVKPPTTVSTSLATLGGVLARKLLACTTSLGCTTVAYDQDAVPEAASLALALGPRGFFAVRRKALNEQDEAASAPVVARAEIPMTNGNAALFGTELESGWTWTRANYKVDGHFVFLYGFPIGVDALPIKEATVDNLAYSFNRWPGSDTDNGKFADDRVVHVFVCFNKEIDVPHLTGVEHSHGRMQRKGALLSDHEPAYCPKPSSLQASVASPMKLLAMSLLPKTWSAMFFGDVRTPVIGGSAWDFSPFAPVGANTAGKLVMETNFVDRQVFAIGDPKLNFKITATSGSNTPMEIEVELYIAGNSGAPGGAEIGGGDLIRWTDEENGTVEFNSMSLGKAGGYTICARAVNVTGFTFNTPCTGLIYAR